MLKKFFQYFKVVLALFLFAPIFQIGSEEKSKKPSLSYQEIRRYRSWNGERRVDLNLVTEGVAPNTKVKLKTQLLDGSCREAGEYFTILDNGIVGYEGLAHLFTISSYYMGEPLVYILTTEDANQMASVMIVPFPFEIKDSNGHRLTICLTSLDAKMFFLRGEGFKPFEKLKLTSQSGDEYGMFEVNADAKGVICSTLAPEIVGKTSGTSTVELIGDNAKLRLVYPWGKLIPTGDSFDWKLSN